MEAILLSPWRGGGLRVSTAHPPARQRARLQVDFPFEGPFGEAMAEQLADLAASIAEEPGLIWKIWTENAQDSKAGGIYLFADETSALAYLHKHQERLKGFGVPEVRAQVFAVNTPLSRVTHAPLPA